MSHFLIHIKIKSNYVFILNNYRFFSLMSIIVHDILKEIHFNVLFFHPIYSINFKGSKTTLINSKCMCNIFITHVPFRFSNVVEARNTLGKQTLFKIRFRCT